MLYWGWAMRHNHDWDYEHLLEVNVLKLRRMHALFSSPDSYHSPDCINYLPKMKSLRLALKLGQRILDDKYDDHLVNNVDVRFEPNGDTTYIMVLVDSKTKRKLTDEELKVRHELWARADRRKDRDRKIFYSILAKYSIYWWD